MSGKTGQNGEASAAGVSTAQAPSAAICRVTADVTHSGDGNDWISSPMTLQAALGSVKCSEVWVKAGVYRPGDSVDDSFTIRPGVAMYGGFAGSEIERGQRDVIVNATILSGEIDHSDDNTDNNTDNNSIDESWLDIDGDNSVHVVLMDGTTAAGDVLANTVLDGFTITGGYALGVGAGGGGLMCAGQSSGHACSPSLSNLIFSGNYGTGGGGATFNGSDQGQANPILMNVSFSGNSSSHGGGMFADGSDNGVSNPVLTNVTFSDNTSSMIGGAMAIDGTNGSISPSLTNVTFSDNRSAAGAAIAVDASLGLGTPTLRNVTFAGNSSNASAGIIYLKGSSDGHVQMTINSTILFDATGPEIYNDGAEVYMGYSIIAGGCPTTGSLCYAIATTDPQLGPLAYNGGSTRTMLPALTSPAIDGGYDYGCPTTDQRGATRPQGGACDIGAVEVMPELIFADSFE